MESEVALASPKYWDTTTFLEYGMVLVADQVEVATGGFSWREPTYEAVAQMSLACC
jgi:hypothetical protein